MASRVLHVGALAVLVVALGGGGVHARVPTLPVLWASADGVGRAARPGATVDVARVDLSQSDKYSEIAVVDDRILLFGPPARRMARKPRTPAMPPRSTRRRWCWATSTLAVAPTRHWKVDRYCRCSRSTRTCRRVGVAQAWSCA